MEKKNIGLGVAALAAGAGAVALAAKNHKNNVKNEVKKAAANAPEQEYRNTERGKNEKNRHQKPDNAVSGSIYLGCGICGPERWYGLCGAIYFYWSKISDRWAGTDPMYRFFEKAWIWR